MVIENPLDLIAPLQVLLHPVDKPFRGAAVTNEQNMLLIIPLGAHGMKSVTDQIPLQRFQYNINREEIKYHSLRKVPKVRILVKKKQDHGNKQKPDQIGLTDISELISPLLHPLRSIEMEYAVKQQISRHDDNERRKIVLRCQQLLLRAE